MANYEFLNPFMFTHISFMVIVLKMRDGKYILLWILLFC